MSSDRQWLDSEAVVTLSKAEKGEVMKQKNKKSESLIIAVCSAVAAIFNFLTSLIHIWIK